MNCRQCGTPIPKDYLKRESFHCPVCGKLYRRKPSQPPAKAPSKPAQRSKTNTGVKGFLVKKVWKLPMWAVILIVLFLMGTISNLGASDQPTQPQATVTPTAEAKTEPFTLSWNQLGDWGKTITLNAGTETEYSYIGFYLPAGEYRITNKDTSTVQVSVYADGITVTDGVEEPSSTISACVIFANESANITVQDNQYVKLSDNNTNIYFEPLQ